ncbi:PRC-barrel domain-containing protein [Methylobacterium segetis]|uniref:PRC-barrel domain-containing protein n=1 Tax=Methylobacterium segetis TaxID=2488750 RepID=UPI00105123EB|nr:PRC-barrel domain-containing protein [Methylobacterium segetis]
MVRFACAAVIMAAAFAHGASAAAEEAPGTPFLGARPPGLFSATKLKGLRVIGQDHVRVGSIDDVLVDEEGKVRAVVIDVGGFLGIGEKQVAVPFDLLAWNAGGGETTRATSVATPANAPSAEATRSAGPETMPGAGTSDQALAAVEERRSGTVDGTTGSTSRTDTSRGRATVPIGEPTEAEIRLTKAQLEAAPTFDGKRR